MRDYEVHLPRAILTAALRDAAGIELDDTAEDWETVAAELVQQIISNPEKAEALAQALVVRSHVPEEAGEWPSNPGALKMTEAVGPRDNLADDLPTGSFEDGLNYASVVGNVIFSTREDGLHDHWLDLARSLTEDGKWALPSVLGFRDESFEPPHHPQRITRVLDEVRLRLAHRFADQKPSITERVRDWLASPLGASDWVIASDRIARNYTIIETKHGQDNMLLQSVVSGSYLYVVVIDSQNFDASVRTRLSLNDEEGSIRKLETVLAKKGEAAQKAIGELRFSLD